MTIKGILVPLMQKSLTVFLDCPLHIRLLREQFHLGKLLGLVLDMFLSLDLTKRRGFRREAYTVLVLSLASALYHGPFILPYLFVF